MNEGAHGTSMQFTPAAEIIQDRGRIINTTSRTCSTFNTRAGNMLTKPLHMRKDKAMQCSSIFLSVFNHMFSKFLKADSSAGISSGNNISALLMRNVTSILFIHGSETAQQ